MNWHDTLRTSRDAFIWAAMGAVAFLLWKLRIVLLVAFAAVLVAILLRVMAALIARLTKMPENLALVLSIVLLLALATGTAWLFGSQIYAQFSDMMVRLNQGEDTVLAFLAKRGFDLSSVRAEATSYVTGAVQGMLGLGVSILEGGIVLLISAIYMAAQPQIYYAGLAQMFGPSLRDEAVEGFELIGTSLKLWLLAQLLLMLMVGLLSFLAAWALGLPGPVALGLIAGVTEIVPYVGPFIGGIPAVMVALTQGLDTALWTVGAYICIHIIEGYLVAPPLERHYIRIPPALVLLGILACEVLFGAFGIVVAAPLTAAIFIAVKVFYVRDTLKERTEVPEDAPI